MAYISIYKGVIFIEGDEPTAKVLQKIEYKENSHINTQLKNTNDIKDQFAEKVCSLGGNVVINFKYGQRSLGYFKAGISLFDDNIKWYGTGEVAILSEKRIYEIIQDLSR